MLRYVGRSTSGLKRPQAHFSPRELQKRDHCHNWLRGIASVGLHAEIEVLEVIVSEEVDAALNEAEDFWIQYLRSIGCPLTNLREGGLNGMHSEETKRKIALKSASISQEVREKKRRSMLGKNRGPRPDMVGSLNPNSRVNRLARGLVVRG